MSVLVHYPYIIFISMNQKVVCLLELQLVLTSIRLNGAFRSKALLK
jgi:hypothetical protein